MIRYEQDYGKILLSDGKLLALGYSGHGEGVNNPAMEKVPRAGPIPCGYWEMVEFLEHHGDHGPAVIRLLPKGHDAHGRSGFLCHGDNALLNSSASLGSIVAARQARERMWKEADKTIQVVGPPPAGQPTDPLAWGEG